MYSYEYEEYKINLVYKYYSYYNNYNNCSTDVLDWFQSRALETALMNIKKLLFGREDRLTQAQKLLRISEYLDISLFIKLDPVPSVGTKSISKLRM